MGVSINIFYKCTSAFKIKEITYNLITKLLIIFSENKGRDNLIKKNKGRVKCQKYARNPW